MDSHQRIETLYALSLAITPEETLEATAATALDAYLDRLDCSVGAVFERRDTGEYRLVGPDAAVGADDPLYEAAEDRLMTRAVTDEEHQTSLPVTAAVDDDSHYWLFKLPDFGMLLLGRRGEPFDDAMLTGLKPLNEQLATACRTKQVKTTLSDARRRFEALFTTIDEPMVTVGVGETGCEIGRTNAAFTATFGQPTAPVDGIDPTDLTPNSDPDQLIELESRLRDGHPVTEAVRRQTTTGTGEFLLRGVPVRTPNGQEIFLLYVDITEERRRQRTLASLSEESATILTSDDQATACDRTVATVVSVLDVAVAEIHRYDRGTDTLQPAATTAETPVFSQSDAADSSVLWATYDGTPHRIDALSETDTTLRCDDETIESVLSLPLGDHGVVIVGDDRPDSFDETARQLGQLLAAFGRIALTRTERVQSLEAIQSITQDAVTADSVDEMVETVVDQLPTATNFPTAGVWRADPATDQLKPIGATGRAAELIGTHPTFEPGNSLAWEAYEAGETRLVSDVQEHREAYNDASVIRSEVITPIGEFGVLIPAAMRPQNITVGDQKIAETLASSLTTAIKLIENRRDLQLLEAVTDRVLRHNLRTDLSVIKSRIQQLAEDCDETAFTEQMLAHAEGLESTAETARTMRTVVQRRDDRRELPVETVIEDGIAAAPEPPADVDLVVDIDTTATVVGHPKLPAAVAHLIENALEHATQDGGEIRVTATADDEVHITVADDGPGIPTNELAVLDQADESTLSHASGAGLWLIDRIATYSGGIFAADVDDGTIAQITLQRP